MFYYTEEQKQFLRDNVKGITLKELTKRFNERFGTNKSENSIRCQKTKLHLYSGITGGQFKKGDVPANKGKKMSAEQYERCKATMFKKGTRPKNYDSVGTEKQASDGYIYIKISDKTNVPKKENWKQKHKLLWEKHHGPVPAGHKLIFLDGNKMNITLENLALVTDAELLIMNRRKLIFDNAEATKSGINVARLISIASKRKKESKK